MLLKGETKIIAFKGLYQKYNGATTASPGQSCKTHHWKGRSSLSQNSRSREGNGERHH